MVSSSDLVSVILPTQNRKERLLCAVRSVFAQTYPHLECLVIDDASWDGTAEALKKAFPQVRTFSLKEPSGPAACRNLGIQRARGEYLAFLDSDDAFLPEKLTLQIPFMRERGFAISQTYEIWYRGGVRVKPLLKHIPKGGSIFEDSLNQVVISSSSVVCRRRVFEVLGLFDESLPVCEDYDFWLRATRRFTVGVLQRELVVKDGGRADQLSFQYRLKDRYRVRALLKLLKSDNLSERERKATLEALRKKCWVIAQGAKKRKKWRRFLYYLFLPLWATEGRRDLHSFPRSSRRWH